MTQQEFFTRYTYKPSTDKLGGGAFGSIYKAYDNKKKELCIIKTSIISDDKNYNNLTLANEYNFSKSLPIHPYLIKYSDYYSYFSEGSIYEFVVMKYLPMGDLQNFLSINGVVLLNIRTFLIHVLEALNLLHKNGIVHKDLKPSNILVFSSNRQIIPKLSDFSISQKFDIIQGYSKNELVAGSLAFSAPEQFELNSRISPSTDLWSFGLLVYWIYTGEYLLEYNNSFQITQSDINKQLSKLDNHKIPDDLKAVIKACVVNNSNDRVSNASDCISMIESFNQEQTTLIYKNQYNSYLLSPTIDPRKLDTPNFAKDDVVDYEEYYILWHKYCHRGSDLKYGFFLTGYFLTDLLTSFYPTHIIIIGNPNNKITISIHYVYLLDKHNAFKKTLIFSFVYDNKRIFFKVNNFGFKLSEKEILKIVDLKKPIILYNSTDFFSSDIAHTDEENSSELGFYYKTRDTNLIQLFSFQDPTKKIILIGSKGDTRFMEVIDYFLVDMYTIDDKLFSKGIQIIIEYLD